MQHPVANLIFRQIDRRHKRQDDIMQRDADGGGDLVTIEQPRDSDGEQCLHAPQRRESKKNTDGHAQRDRMGRIGDGNQAFVVGAPPILESGKPTGTNLRRARICRINFVQKAPPASMEFSIFVQVRHAIVMRREAHNRDCYC